MTKKVVARVVRIQAPDIDRLDRFKRTFGTRTRTATIRQLMDSYDHNAKLDWEMRELERKASNLDGQYSDLAFKLDEIDDRLNQVLKGLLELGKISRGMQEGFQKIVDAYISKRI